MALKSHTSPSLPRYRGPWSPLPGPLGLPGLLSMSQLTLQPSAQAAVCPRQRADPVPRVSRPVVSARRPEDAEAAVRCMGGRGSWSPHRCRRSFHFIDKSWSQPRHPITHTTPAFR